MGKGNNNNKFIRKQKKYQKKNSAVTFDAE